MSDPTKPLLRLVLALLLIGIGVTAFIYADIDDSPGGMLIGALIAAGGAWLGLTAVMRMQKGR